MQRVVSQIAFVLLVAGLAFVSPACGSGKGNPGSGSDVAATVNGKDITLAEVDRIVNKQAQGQTLSTLQQAAARLQVLDGLIQRQLVFQRAEKEKIVPGDDEVTTFINQQKQGGTVEEWEKYLSDNKLTEQQVREEARRDLAISKLQEKYNGKISIRDQEIIDFYNTNRAQFINPRGVSISGIVVDPSDSGGVFKDDAKSDAEAAAKINRLYTQLKTGADFATVARASSEDQSFANGGDIGFFDENKLRQAGFPSDLIGKFFNAMKVGDYTEAIHFPDGRWGIFKLTNRQLENKPLALEDANVRANIKEALINQRQTILNEALIRNAMSDAQIVNKLAESMLNDPNMLGGLQQVSPGAATTPASTPAATATPAASPSATATAQPAATSKPAAPAATPKAAPTRPLAAPTRPAAAPSPKQ